MLKPRLDWLLVCVPIAAWLHYATSHHTATFIVACIASVRMICITAAFSASRTSCGVPAGASKPYHWLDS